MVGVSDHSSLLDLPFAGLRRDRQLLLQVACHVSTREGDKVGRRCGLAIAAVRQTVHKPVCLASWMSQHLCGKIVNWAADRGVERLYAGMTHREAVSCFSGEARKLSSEII